MSELSCCFCRFYITCNSFLEEKAEESNFKFLFANPNVVIASVGVLQRKAEVNYICVCFFQHLSLLSLFFCKQGVGNCTCMLVSLEE